MRRTFLYIVFFLCFLSSGSAKTTTATTPGPWTSAGTWNNGVPASGDIININVDVVYNTNFSCGGSGILTINTTGSLTDAPGGKAYDFDLVNTATLILMSNMTIEGTLTVANNTDLVLTGCDTLIFGNGDFSNSGLLAVDSCSAMIGNGDMTISNSFQIGAGGFIRVDGDVTLSNSAEVTGDGNFFATGCIEFQNTASLFGDNTDCCPGPCFRGTGYPLPLKLLYFTLEKEASNVRFEWASLSEENLDRYILQRSSDLRLWENSEEVLAAGFSNSVLTYECFEEKLGSRGTIYYRLKALDFDGSYSYSQVLTVRQDESKNALFCPNPVDNVIHIPNNTEEIRILDSSGRLLLKGIGEQLDISELPAGFYYLKCANNSESLVK